jgi:hypothetical protein
MQCFLLCFRLCPKGKIWYLVKWQGYRLVLHLTEYSSFVSQTCHGSLYTVNEGKQVESQKDSTKN